MHIELRCKGEAESPWLTEQEILGQGADGSGCKSAESPSIPGVRPELISKSHKSHCVKGILEETAKIVPSGCIRGTEHRRGGGRGSEPRGRSGCF